MKYPKILVILFALFALMMPLLACSSKSSSTVTTTSAQVKKWNSPRNADRYSKQYTATIQDQLGGHYDSTFRQ